VQQLSKTVKIAVGGGHQILKSCHRPLSKFLIFLITDDYDKMGAMSSVVPYVGVEEVSGKTNIIKTLKACTAEFIGTLFLVLVGCGSCLGSEANFVRIALAFGVTVATMAQSIGHVSGCHINPAVTAGLFFGRKIGLIRGLFYIVVQCLGAVVGGGLLCVRPHIMLRDL
jgi:hypothetical protein